MVRKRNSIQQFTFKIGIERLSQNDGMKPPTIYDLFPKDHLARVNNEVVDGLDLRELDDRCLDLGCNHQLPELSSS